MLTPSNAALGMASLLIGHDNITRIEPIVSRGRFSLDRTKEISSLKGLGDSEARKALPTLNKIFLNDHAEPFEACH